MRQLATPAKPLLFSLLVALALAPAAGACPWHKSWLLFGFWAPVINPELLAGVPADHALHGHGHAAHGESEPVRVEVRGGPSDVGQWQPPVSWPVIAIHTALLPTGETIHYSYPSGGPGSNARTWDPVSGNFEDVSFSTDLFCSGLSLQPDGKLYVTGGNGQGCDFVGLVVTNEFDPETRQWTSLSDMVTGRWYPTNLTLGDGTTLILSGLDQTCNTTPIMERYGPGQGLEVIPEGERFTALYPRLHLLPSGRVAHVGPERQTFTFDPVTRQWEGGDDMLFGSRWDGASVLVPGSPAEVMACGGSEAVVTDTCERIDFAAADPEWRSTGAMSFARSHGNLVILPDRKVLMIGGGTDGLYGDPVLNAELYDPDAETWALLPPQVHGRMYHSTAVLLPDGRVLTAGQDNGQSAFFGEIYEPPYLFAGARPVIDQAPTAVRYGESFTIDTQQAGSIAEVALIAPSTVTHSVNNGQRYVGLAFSASGADELSVTAPTNPSTAPPGYYMLFIVDGDGVPSVAPFVRVESDGLGIFADGFEAGSAALWN